MNVSDLKTCLNFSRLPKQPSGQRAWPERILMTDEDRLADPLPTVESLPRGSAVILRHYGFSGREELARRLVSMTRRRHIKVLVAADARLAHRVGADGLHLPEAMAALGPGPWRAWAKPGWMVTAAAHSPAALFRAQASGADAVLLSPVFPTASHPEAAGLGPVRFSRWCRQSPLPVYALGGLTAAGIKRLEGSNVMGFAGISGFVENGSPRGWRGGADEGG